MIKIIGAGLAGCEAAWYLAGRGEQVELIEQKPLRRSPAHTSDAFCELVCSNSLKSDDVFGNACGLLKEELRRLGSVTMAAAEETRVPAGGALAVDRDRFSAYVTQKIRSPRGSAARCTSTTRPRPSSPPRAWTARIPLRATATAGGRATISTAL